MKHRQMTDTQKRNIECSCCLRCGWRIPFWGNDPMSCLFNIMGKYDMRECKYRPKCSMYVQDITLEKHIKNILRTDETELTHE